MDQNLGQRKTQTVTHTPIGYNGADSMGEIFHGNLREGTGIMARKDITTDADLAEALNDFNLIDIAAIDGLSIAEGRSGGQPRPGTHDTFLVGT